MMLTLLSTFMSFLSGGLPSLLNFFQDKSDKKHELAMAQVQVQMQLEMQKAGFQAQERVEEIHTEQIQIQTASDERKALYNHDIGIGKGASQWAVNARSLVRPIVTYILLLLLVFIEVAGFIYATQTGVPFPVAIDKLWDKDMEVVWASVLSFWFGSRAFAKN